VAAATTNATRPKSVASDQTTHAKVARPKWQQKRDGSSRALLALRFESCSHTKFVSALSIRRTAIFRRSSAHHHSILSTKDVVGDDSVEAFTANKRTRWGMIPLTTRLISTTDGRKPLLAYKPSQIGTFSHCLRGRRRGRFAGAKTRKGQPQERQHSAAFRRDAGPTAVPRPVKEAPAGGLAEAADAERGGTRDRVPPARDPLQRYRRRIAGNPRRMVHEKER
jgi:hypothetical protein